VGSIVGIDTVMTLPLANREAVAISPFGPLAIRERIRSLRDRDLSGGRPKQVLKATCAARPRRVPADRPAQLLWCEPLAQDATEALETFISVVRYRLSDEVREAPIP
jgi:hypothetical protein